jgi:hypothetical protein
VLGLLGVDRGVRLLVRRASRAVDRPAGRFVGPGVTRAHLSADLLGLLLEVLAWYICAHRLSFAFAYGSHGPDLQVPT